MIKMLVSSFYNTLINEEEAIPASTMLEIDRVRKQKIKFVVMTNRLAEEILYYNKDYPFIDYIISLNGSLMLEVATGKVTRFSFFTKKELEEIQEKYKKYEITCYAEKEAYNFFSQEPIYKIEIKLPKKKEKELPQENKYHTSIFQIENETYLELTKNTPYEALKELLKEINITEEETLGMIGNEAEEALLEMKNIYVVRNAPKSLKDQSEKKTKSNQQKGVESVIKKEIK